MSTADRLQDDSAKRSPINAQDSIVDRFKVAERIVLFLVSLFRFLRIPGSIIRLDKRESF